MNRAKMNYLAYFEAIALFGALAQEVVAFQYKERIHASKHDERGGRGHGTKRHAFVCVRRMCQMQTREETIPDGRRTHTTNILVFVHSNVFKVMKIMSI